MAATSRRDQVIAAVQARAEELRGLGVRGLWLFGSVARDEAGPGSDVDVLVDFGGPPGFDQYMDVKLLLEDLLGARVDLVTRRALRPLVREEVEREALRVA